MITLTSALKAKKNALHGGGEWIWLAEIWRDTTNVLRYTNAHANVTFNSLTWTSKPLRVKRPDQDNQGSLFNWTVQVSNVNRVVAGYLKDGEILGDLGSVLLVHRTQLSDSSAYMRWRGRCLSFSVGTDWATLEYGPPPLRDVQVPAGVFSRDRCQHDEFGGPFCQYAGVETSCLKTRADCLNTMSNLEHMLAFPGIPCSRP